LVFSENFDGTLVNTWKYSGEYKKTIGGYTAWVVPSTGSIRIDAKYREASLFAHTEIDFTQNFLAEASVKSSYNKNYKATPSYKLQVGPYFIKLDWDGDLMPGGGQ